MTKHQTGGPGPHDADLGAHPAHVFARFFCDATREARADSYTAVCAAHAKESRRADVNSAAASLFEMCAASNST